MSDRIDISFTLNGQPVTASIAPKAPALGVLREDLGCTTLKAGCSPQGVCGSCAALVGGKSRLTCTLPAKTLAGKEVLTQAGLDPAQAELIGRAFAASGLARAGYEVPGLVMALVGLRAESSDEPLSAEAVRKALGMHVSRSFGYEGVVEAFLLADRALRGEEELPTASHTLVQAALGRRPSAGDLARPGMLHAAVVLANTGNGVLAGLDTAAAQADGVQILTAADLPGPTGLGPCVADGPVLLPVGGHLASAAPVALVLAESAESARAAAAKVVVQGTEGPAPEGEHRRLRVAEGESADGAAALAACAHRVRRSLSVAAADPLAVEPDAALAVPLAEGRFRVYATGLDLFRELEQLCAVSGLDPDLLELEHLPAGGAFGARLEPRVAALALLGAQKSGRPVRLALEMEEATRLHAIKPALRLELELGADASGRLKALVGRVELHGGASTGAAPLLLDALARQARLAYTIPDLHLDLVALRGPGSPAAAVPGALVAEWAVGLEGAIDALAAALGRDGLELRRDNLAAFEGIDTTDFLARLEAELRATRARGGSVGLALGAQRPGLPGDSALAIVQVQSPGHLVAFTGFSEHGQGFEAEAAELVAGLCGLPVDNVEVRTSTAAEVPCGPTLADRDRLQGLPALRLAAEALLAADDSLDGLVGRSFLGEAAIDAPAGLSAVIARIGEDEGLAEVIALVATGPDGLDEPTRGWLQSAVQLGLETAITAEREALPTGLAEARWTKLGLLKAKALPPIQILAVPQAEPPPLFDALLTAVPAAVLAALGGGVTALPAKDNGVARRMGVRPPRPS